MNNPFVYVIVLTYNGARWLKNLLNSLIQSTYPNFNILVIDNCSLDDSVDIIKKYLPNVELILNDRNIGFAAGMNKGILYALSRQAEFVFLLNQDTILAPHCLEELVKVARQNPRNGILVPVQFRYGSDQLHATFQKWLALNVGVSDLQSLQRQDKTFFVVKEVLGPAMLISREAIEAVGTFDPYYFANFEETDLCRRLRFHRFFNALCPRAFFWHDENLFDESKEIPMMRSHFIFCFKDPYKNEVYRFLLATGVSLKNLSRIIFKKKYYLLKYSIKSLFEVFINIRHINKRRYQEINADNNMKYLLI
jgi:GT2 family glycosyltransferase